ncbi:MAG TPA: copper resistance protein CopC [Propionibacteriaceae bacterium]|nr:copper resistance protein CopC [Propionibacteriaceae bacterium]
MALLRTIVRRVALLATLAAVLSFLLASPALAHAELVSMSPANGTQLTRPPTEVRMTFTESINLVDNGIRLVDHVGANVPTPQPTVSGRTVIWPMPPDLPEGPYIVTWRVVSADGHPVSGASSFGVGTAATGPGSVTGTAEANVDTVAGGSTAPWPVVAIRLAGYLAFALVAGVTAFVLFCSPDSSKNKTLQLLVRGGLLLGGFTAVAVILVQGPYTAGASMSRALDIRLIQQTLGTPFGTTMMWRLGLYCVLAVLAWRLPRILTELASWLLPACLVGTAVTIAAAGHAAAYGLFELLVDTVHALTAGIWVGGLVAIAALGRAVEPRGMHKFSTVAMASVLTLIATGTLNALRHLSAVDQLWQTRYGFTLLIKLALVAGTIAIAAISRRRLQRYRVPLRSVRYEVAMTVAVLIVTALLSMTAPPTQASLQPASTGPDAGAASVNAVAQMSLHDSGTAALAIMPATTAGSHLHLVLSDNNGKPLKANRVTLKVAAPGRGVAPIPVPMSMRDGVWVGSFRFPFSGTWKAVVSVDGIAPSVIVTSADIKISG